MTETPIACSLTAADYRRRTAETDQLARRSLLDRQAIDGGARLTFAADGTTREQLETLIAAESSCCPFLTMDLRSTDDRLVLDVTGPADAAPVIENLFA